VNRVVTGVDAHGKSIIWRSGEHDNRIVLQGTNCTIIDLWQTDAAPSSARNQEDTGMRPYALDPPVGGSVFRLVEIAPDDTWTHNREVVEEILKSRDSFAPAGRASTDPCMHVTSTTDYVIVLKGEIWATMEEGEVLLKAGDVLIQRGTWHAWHNRSREPCVLAGVALSNRR
jgi:mannose-6-phosphate isomerase-like protein (cupin superfamily)